MSSSTACGLFVDPEGEGPLERIYERFVGEPVSFEKLPTSASGRSWILNWRASCACSPTSTIASRKAAGLPVITLVGLRQALREVVACFPVYRTAKPQRRLTAGSSRHRMGGDARATAQCASRQDGVRLYSCGAYDGSLQQAQPIQPTGSAAGDEVPAVYRTGGGEGGRGYGVCRYNRLVANNEVGGEPTRFGTTVSAFHKITQDAGRRWPHAMLSTATHDTKRGEDARARIDVLSEMPTEWGGMFVGGRPLNHRRKAIVNDEPAPTANDEYLLYQALVGSWPMEFHDQADLEPQAVSMLSGAHFHLHDKGGP